MASFKIAGLPIKGRLQRMDSWRVSMGESDAQAQYTISRTSRGAWEQVNIWRVREDFFSVVSAEDALRFFRLYGPMQLNDSVQAVEACTTEVSLGTVFQIQNWFKLFMEEPSPEWAMERHFDMTTPEGLEDFSMFFALGYRSPSFTIEMGYVRVKNTKVPSPYLNYLAFDVFSAVYASIYLDKMRGLRGAVCQRDGCTNTFLTTDPRKRFCDGPGDCSAVERMKKRRNAERMSKTTEGTHGKA